MGKLSKRESALRSSVLAYLTFLNLRRSIFYFAAVSTKNPRLCCYCHQMSSESVRTRPRATITNWLRLLLLLYGPIGDENDLTKAIGLRRLYHERIFQFFFQIRFLAASELLTSLLDFIC